MHFGTRHAVVYEGRVATLFTPHSNCLNSHEFSPTNHGNFILHPFFDLAIDTHCLPTPSALDLTSVFVPSLGDEIIAFGFGVTANVWQGLVAGFTRDWICSSPATHWNSTLTRVCDGEIVAQGHQHEGMSGAPVLNGCGYVGMAHAVNSKVNAITAIFAYIIPASLSSLTSSRSTTADSSRLCQRRGRRTKPMRARRPRNLRAPWASAQELGRPLSGETLPLLQRPLHRF